MLCASQALGPWIKCLEAWARKGSNNSQAGKEGPWTTITQPSAAVLSRADPSSETPSAQGSPLSAHKSLTVILFRIMLLGDDVEGSPHRNPSLSAWAAARAYLLMLSLPGAAAYGVLQPAVLGMVLTNLRSWCRNSSVYRPGGAGGSAAAMGEKKRGSQKRRRSEEDDGADDDDDDSDGEGGRGRGGGRRTVGRGAGGVSRGDEVQACLKLLKACLACVPLASHQV